MHYTIPVLKGPGFEKQVLRCDFGVFKRFRRRRFAAVRTYTGLLAENRGPAIKSWTKSAEIRRMFKRRGGV